jgi:hypothetical protein
MKRLVVSQTDFWDKNRTSIQSMFGRAIFVSSVDNIPPYLIKRGHRLFYSYNEYSDKRTLLFLYDEDLLMFMMKYESML